MDENVNSRDTSRREIFECGPRDFRVRATRFRDFRVRATRFSVPATPGTTHTEYPPFLQPTNHFWISHTWLTSAQDEYLLGKRGCVKREPFADICQFWSNMFLKEHETYFDRSWKNLKFVVNIIGNMSGVTWQILNSKPVKREKTLSMKKFF